MKEADVHKAIVQYLSLIDSSLIVVSDPNGIRLTIGQATQLKKIRLPHAGGHPDILVLRSNSDYNGLFIEVKKEGTKVYTKNGTHYSEHLKKQDELHIRLRKEGWFGGFAIGFDSAKRMIDEYFNL